VVLFSLFFFNNIIEIFFSLSRFTFIIFSILISLFLFFSVSTLLADDVCGHEDIEIPSRSIYCSLEFLCFHLWMCAGVLIFFSKISDCFCFENLFDVSDRLEQVIFHLYVEYGIEMPDFIECIVY
jgi:hypothetical protein